MKKIRIHCSGCMKSFDFQHPAIGSVERLLNVTLDCPNCGETLKAPDDELTMITMTQYMVRQMRKQGVEVTEEDVKKNSGYIELADVIPIDRNR